MTGRNARPRSAAFTLVEILVAMAVFGVFLTGLLATWSTLGFASLNTTNYTRRQNDQMRVLDYLRRDIQRASQVQLYNGGTLIAGTTTFAPELRLTIPDYYADPREEDNVSGSKVPLAPSVVGSTVSYGTALTVRYYTSQGAGIRNEAGTVRTVADAAGAFTFSFKRETSGAIRCRVLFDQPLRGGKSRTLRRQVDTLCVPRSELQL